ncbi:MAG TPA: translation initiation factor [Chitinophagales bacterium]
MSSNRNKGKSSGLVYSTNPDFVFQNEEEAEDIPASEQLLYVSLDRLKGNKIATVIENFKGSDNSLTELAKVLKAKCGTGGSAKDGVIIIQGEKREQILTLLAQQGFKTKKKGG